MEFLQRYQQQAAGKGVDPLGYYVAPWAYADLQVSGEAVEQTKSLDQDKIADTSAPIPSRPRRRRRVRREGRVEKGPCPDRSVQNITGTSIDDFRDGKGEVVLWPDAYKAGEPILPTLGKY